MFRKNVVFLIWTAVGVLIGALIFGVPSLTLINHFVVCWGEENKKLAKV